MQDHLPLFHSWPLFDMASRMEMASLALLDPEHLSAACLPVEDGLPGIGVWSCDMRTGRLNWTREVHELFGLPDNVIPTRAYALSCYEPHSRHAMERLREHSIKHRRGFTLDATIRRPSGERRWMRLTAMPVLSGGKVIRLVGTKQDVTHHYESVGWQDV